ncbi:sigma-70 family RNA polymerase sigma factor [Candidatus Woesearchaeota archaeon]|nr:sigma-70 family RNA polymerase sigma factor [Candidatus Woesearchaeota archaeon]
MSRENNGVSLDKIKKCLATLDNKVLIHFDNSPDFLTAFSAWKIYPDFITPTERILLSSLNGDQLAYFTNYIPMMAYGFDFERIDRIAQSFFQSEKRKLEYALNSNHTKQLKNGEESLVEEIAFITRQQYSNSKDVFTSAFNSIHKESKKNILDTYLENLVRAYSNLSELKKRYSETKKVDEYPEDNPAFNKIIQIYTTTKDPSLLNVIIPKYKGFIWKLLTDILKKVPMENKILEKNDYYMAGITGFIEALGKFDPSIGVRVTSWTAPRIIGAIFDELRNFDILSREERHKLTQYNKTKDESEAAEIFGISQPELRQISSLAFIQEISLDSILLNDRDDKPLTLGDSIEVINAVDDYRSLTPIDNLYYKERSEKIVEAVRKLSGDERKVFRAYCFQNMTIKQIGHSGILGRTLSESRVFQIYADAINKIISHIGRNNSELSDFVNNCLRSKIPQ